MINIEKWNKLRAGHSAKLKVKVVVFYISLGDGNGDLEYNTCREIIDRNETHAWAHMALEEVFRCLEMGQRWPDYMSHLIKVSDQYRMTQDPWLLAYCCAVRLGRIDLIRKYKPNFFMFLPDKWAWRRALLGKQNLYWLWRLFPHTLLNKIRIKRKGKNQGLLQDFVFVMYGYMDQAYRQIQ